MPPKLIAFDNFEYFFEIPNQKMLTREISLIEYFFLFQSLESELVCSTAYLELFIRRITDPRLLAVFLQFLFTESHDGKVIIDILVTRLALQSQVRENQKSILTLQNIMFSILSAFYCHTILV